MVEYYLGREYRINRRMRWTYRKSFIAVMVVGVASWAGIISLAHLVVQAS